MKIPCRRFVRLFMNRFFPYLLLCCLIIVSSALSQEKFSIESGISKFNYHSPTIPSYKNAAEFFKPGDSSVKKGRVWLVAGTQAAIWAGSYIALNQAWYADYPKSNFHFFDDWDEWGKMDKLGHMWTAYNIGRVSGALWQWTGMKKNTSVWLGGASALAYQSIIEILDGFSSEWGFSMGDMTANVVGASSYVAQELLWKDQRIQIKMSYWAYDYPPDLIGRRNDLFGSGSLERILKDYNSQTYWLSGNLKSFFPKSNLPAWLDISFGYNSRVMLGASSNIWIDKDGNTVDRSDVERYRRIFFAPDIDLTKIKTKSKFLKSVFYLLNMVKMPLPTLEYDTRGKFVFHPLYF